MNRWLSILVAFVAAGSLGVSLPSCNEPSLRPRHGAACSRRTARSSACPSTRRRRSRLRRRRRPSSSSAASASRRSVRPEHHAERQRRVRRHRRRRGSVPPCRTPSAGQRLRQRRAPNFVDNMANALAPIHVASTTRSTLLSRRRAARRARLHRGGSYVFQNFPPPGLGLIVVVVGDADGDQHLTSTATGDADRLRRQQRTASTPTSCRSAVSDGWSFDIDSTGGAYIAKFYSDAEPAPNLLVANEKHPGRRREVHRERRRRRGASTSTPR